MKKGIDVSRYQKKIDWNIVKNYIDFAILRIGYGKFDYQKDEFFEDNYNKAISNNVVVGVYHYTYATTESEAIQEAKCVINWLKNRELQLPIYFDIEESKLEKLGKQKLTNICKSFCTEIEKAGYWAGIYASKYWLSTILDGKELEKLYTIWVAQYNNICTYSGKYDIWQKTSAGKINGINGYVDLNIMYRDLIQDIQNTKNKIEEIKIKKSYEEISEEIIKGKWGNGQDRINKLLNNGYTKNEIQQIQKIVNNKLS